MNNRLINTKVAGGGGCTDIVDNYDPFDGNGVALYQLNGNANDVSGNYNGTAYNVTYGTGVFGQAGVFNGTSSYISTATTNAFNLQTFTVSVWAKLNSFAPDLLIVSNSGTSETPSGTGWNVAYYDSTNAFYFGNAGVNLTFTTTPILTNVWYHIVATVDLTSNKIKIFLNGVFENENTYNGISYNSGTRSLRIGKVGYYDELYWNGSIDQVRIFNTALDPLEIEALYTEELCICDGTVDTLDILGDGSCIATYQLDGNANDLSGNYSGTPTDVSYGVGEFDLAGVFNGSTSRINIISPISNSTDTTDFSVSIWVKPTNVFTSNFEGVIGQAGGYDQYPFGLIIRYISANSYRIEFSRGYNNVFYQYLYTHTTPINFNNWQLITATYNSSIKEYKVYLNSQLLETTSTKTTFTPYSIDPNISLGQYNANGVFNAYAFEGSIDQVRIFNKALNSTEVTTLYNETACTKAACTGTTNTLDILGDGSCIATYPLDGSPADLSGNYNGIQTDVTYPVGEFDLAGSFNATSSIIKTELQTSSNDINSYSFWFKTSGNVSDGVLFDKDNTGTTYGLRRCAINSTGNVFIAAWGGSGNWAISSTAYDDDQWHHVVVTLNYPTKELYIDGQFIDSNSSVLGTTPATNPIVIGARFDGLFSLNGQIDQVRIFNKVLSAGEVTTLYNETPCN